jgi:hypothetical protein
MRGFSVHKITPVLPRDKRLTLRMFDALRGRHAQRTIDLKNDRYTVDHTLATVYVMTWRILREYH